MALYGPHGTLSYDMCTHHFNSLLSMLLFNLVERGPSLLGGD